MNNLSWVYYTLTGNHLGWKKYGYLRMQEMRHER